jgi:4-hydroxy-tetrahydrodipicolinate synthase
MSINPTVTRRQLLAGIGATTLLPYSNLLIAAENKMRGALMILTTPYTADDEVDYEDLAKEVAFCAKCGVQGMVWPQNSSEQRYLSQEERIKGFETLTEANRDTSMALVLGVQADDTAGMLEYAKKAESLNPDGMIAIPPTTADSLEDIRNYYRALCEVTDKPIFVQTSGGPDIELTVDFLVDLATELPQ